MNTNLDKIKSTADQTAHIHEEVKKNRFRSKGDRTT